MCRYDHGAVACGGWVGGDCGVWAVAVVVVMAAGREGGGGMPTDRWAIPHTARGQVQHSRLHRRSTAVYYGISVEENRDRIRRGLAAMFEGTVIWALNKVHPAESTVHRPFIPLSSPPHCFPHAPSAPPLRTPPSLLEDLVMTTDVPSWGRGCGHLLPCRPRHIVAIPSRCVFP